jgi:uncharacterized protein (TIGR03118 family)
MITKSHIKRAGLRFGPAFESIKSTFAPLLCAAAAFTAQAGDDNRSPDLPPVCDRIAAPADNKVVFHVFAVGVQIYHWDGAAWVFVAPAANLYADANHTGQVGIHFGTPSGPAWEMNSGSKVIEQRVDGCTPDSSAIQWLLLRTLVQEGDGVLNGVSFVQRVNTVAGVAPSTPGGFVGEERQVPYTAEYFFYRSTAQVYTQNNLVSDLPDVAQIQDPKLVNSWGVTFGGSGPFWVADSGSGKATLYVVTNDASGTEIVSKQALEVTIPGAGRPTGVVSNNKGGFNGDVFLFAGFDGIISGWRGALGTTAETLATRPGAIYTGLAIVTNSSGPLLLTANFAEGTLDAYSTTTPSTLVAQYTDPNAPAGYVPFNVQVINGKVFVMFSTHEEGRGRGFVDVFDPETGTFDRFATGSDAGGQVHELDMPWGVALAPNSFGKHGGELLVGNFGSGTIMAFGPTGDFRGLLKGVDNRPIEIERLWGLTFGNGGKAGSPDELFFGAGPAAETHGLFGSLKPASETDSRR